MEHIRGQGFEAWSHHAIPPNPGESHCADVVVQTSQGMFIGTFYTRDEIARLMEKADPDEVIPRLYFADRSMVIVRVLDEPTVRAVVEHLVKSGLLTTVFEPRLRLEEEFESPAC